MGRTTAAAHSLATIAFDLSQGSFSGPLGSGPVPHITAEPDPRRIAFADADSHSHFSALAPSSLLPGPALPLPPPGVVPHGLVGPVVGAIRPTNDGSGTVCFSVLLEVDTPAFIECVATDVLSTTQVSDCKIKI